MTAPQQLVQQVLDAYGGRAALEQVKGYRMEGRVVAGLQGREGPVSRLFQRPGRLRVEIHYADRPETRIVDGETGWRGSGSEVTPASGMMLEAMVLQAARSDLPLFLLSHIDSVRTIDAMERDSVRLDGLEVAFGVGRLLRAYIDPATHRIRVSQSWLGAGEDAMNFETEYADYRKVGRVSFAFHERNFASGRPTGTITFESVTLNPRLAPAAFGAPAAKSGTR